MNPSSDQWNLALKTILSRASTEADFRAKCMSHPVAAIKEATGIELPEGIRFTEDSAAPNAIYLPPFGQDPDQIPDSNLSAISGGQVIPTGSGFP